MIRVVAGRPSLGAPGKDLPLSRHPAVPGGATPPICTHGVCGQSSPPPDSLPLRRPCFQTSHSEVLGAETSAHSFRGRTRFSPSQMGPPTAGRPEDAPLPGVTSRHSTWTFLDSHCQWQGSSPREAPRV